MSNDRPSPYLVTGALLAVQILFGINYVVSKVVVGVFPPLVWASLRIIISTVVMFGVALLSGRKHPKAGWKFFGPMIIFALLGTVINQASFLVGLRYTTSTNSAILNTLIPVFTLLVVTIRGQEPLNRNKALGFVFALVGVLVLRKVEDFSLSNETMIGDLLTILNCLSFAFFLSYSKKFLETNDSIWTTAWLFLYGSVGLTALALPGWMSFQWPKMTPNLWLAAIFAIFGATLLTYFLNFWTLAYAKPSHVALYTYLQPVVTSTITFFFYGELITLRTVAASLFIFVGVLLARTKSEPPTKLQPVLSSGT